jgi:hypothetical protein
MANAPSSGTGCVSFKNVLPDGTSEILPVGLICRRRGDHRENAGVRLNPSTSLRAQRSNPALYEAGRDGSIHVAELHWYEAAGIGRKEFKIKHLL